MPSRPTNTRRDFLTGQAAADALAGAIDEATAAAPLPLPSGDAYLVQIGRRAMACQFEVFFNAGQYEQATDAALEALDLIDALEAQLTVYRDSSEVMEINRQAAENAVPVEPRLFALLQYACQLHSETQGTYDITSGPLSKIWGFYRRQGAIPDSLVLEEALSRVGSEHIQLAEESHTIRLDRREMELNLGSIGKGYALDRAAEVLTSAGMSDYLFHGGRSSILARGSHGSHPGRGWLVSIGNPLYPGKALAQVHLRDRALGTSGCGTQFFRHEGRRYGHILDPRTGWPAEGVLSSNVAAPTAAQADALATAFYVMGPQAALEYGQKHPEISLLMACPRSGLGGLEVLSSGFAADDLQLLAAQ